MEPTDRLGLAEGAALGPAQFHLKNPQATLPNSFDFLKSGRPLLRFGVGVIFFFDFIL